VLYSLRSTLFLSLEAHSDELAGLEAFLPLPSFPLLKLPLTLSSLGVYSNRVLLDRLKVSLTLSSLGAHSPRVLSDFLKISLSLSCD